MKYILEHSEFKEAKKFKPGEWVWINVLRNGTFLKKPGKILKLEEGSDRSAPYNINIWYKVKFFDEDKGKWIRKYSYGAKSPPWVGISPMTEEEAKDSKEYIESQLKAKKFNI